MTTVWYNFRANTCSKKAAPGCFGFTGAEGCCGGSSHEFCGKFNLAVVGGSETQTTEKRTWNCSCITIMIKFNLWEKLAFALPYRGTMSWCGHSVRRVSSSCSLTWKLALLKGNPARVLPTWLLQREQTPFDGPYVCEKKQRFSIALGNRIIAQYHWRIQSTHMSHNNPMCRFVSASDLF